MNKKVSLGTTVFLCILVFIVGFMSSWTILRSDYNGKINELYLNYPEAVKLMEIMDYYEKYYISQWDMESSESLALKGFVEGTGDRYGEYYTAEEYEKILEDDNGEFVGIGITVVVTNDSAVEIERVIPNAPADKMGLKKGDVILSVDGIDTSKGAQVMVDALRGEEGSETTLVILREGQEMSFTVKREKINAESVFGEYIKEEKIGFIRIFQFDNTTPEQFKKAINEMKALGAEKFIFDLRDNGGGLLSSIVGVLESLLPKDTLVTTATKKDGGKTEYKTKSGVEDFSYPCAVLVNEHTASAAELFTATLRDYEKAVIVGVNTYGKGVMQSTVVLSDGSALKLTTAYYSTPLGENYDGVGIKPDIQAKQDRIDYYQLNKEDAVIKAAMNELRK